MGTISITLIVLGSVSLFIIVISWGIFSFKKKKIKEEDANDANKEPESVKQDDEFKVTKIGRFSRVSKKALSTDSRTATIERVYEKTPEKEPTDQIINPMALSKESEELIDTINQIEKDDSKVISIGELQKNAEELEMAEENATHESNIEENKSNIRYSGIGIGMDKSNVNNSVNTEIGDNTQSINSEMETIRNRVFGNQTPGGLNNFDFPPRFRTSAPFAPNTSSTSSEETDYNKLIESEAILNPKFKKNKNKK